MAQPADILRRLPTAPVAEVPEGVTVDGAARTVWRPNVLLWMGIWRIVVAAQMLVATWVSDSVAQGTWTVVAIAGAWGVLTLGAASLGAVTASSMRWRAVDLLVLTALLVSAPDQTALALAALYSYSAVIAWSVDHPAGAFLAAALLATTYVVAGLVGPYADERPAAFVGNLALYFFFALAVSGFFTVARRISALEIATEMSRERGRYRRDLHDRLGQALCGLHFELQALQSAGPDDASRERFSSLADGYGSARSMLEDLFADTDEPLMATNIGLLLHQEARRMADQSSATITPQVTGDPSRIPPWMRPHVWSIAGECMTNALKNGQASTITIDLVVEDGLLVLSVSDDGIGFDAPPGEIPVKEGHYGLREMQERARICGGEVVVVSQPGFGTRVRLQVPLPLDGEADAIIDRDASALRDSTWNLLNVLRAGLGIVALAQLAAGTVAGVGPAAVLVVVGVLMAIDIAAPLVLHRGEGAVRRVRMLELAASTTLYVGLFAVAAWTGTPPYVMLYAPLVLLQAGIAFGRHAAAWLTLAFAGGAVGVVLVDALVLPGEALAAGSLMYITNLVIIGLCATQGARLLDRLEALQIRVRYQAMALIRQSLSGRMRNDLVAVLDELEDRTRRLAAAPPEPDAFVTATEPLAEGSTKLKVRLREIVHQLAEPDPGRT